LTVEVLLEQLHIAVIMLLFVCL